MSRLPNGLTETKLKNLLQNHYISEIADSHKIKPQVLQYHCRKLGLKSQKKFGGWNKKYSVDLRKHIIKYFKTHTTKETALHFGLKHGQVIGILETSRRSGILKSSYKDKRSKDSWTFEQDLKLLQSAGLRQRSHIAKLISRRSSSPARIVKERMKRFGGGTKFLHGMPASWVKELFGEVYQDRLVQTKAGPNGLNGQWCFKIIPWVDLYHIAHAHNHALLDPIRAMATFQMFIFQTDNEQKIRSSIRRICK